ncbi:DUF5984 family protein [Listeria booriae]|uniref:DUF5984 family protein n=1 Tax=Listeria booriae TaxID=1552123 RepID=UPI0016264C65|nr:DUF5984 family protein [Listeria booriae]MBC2163653.1 hypothetical protein [Listeria booriae]
MNQSEKIVHPISIKYKLETNADLGEGKLQFYIGNQDICSYKKNNKIESYSSNLFCVVTWLCENIEYIIGYDPFPLPVSGYNIQTLIEEADKFESDDLVEEYLWYNAKSIWIFKHNWFSCREGSILPQVYFRRIENNIEIYWDNDFWEESGIVFQVPRGSTLVDRKVFKEIITNFVNSFLEEVSASTNDKKQMERIENLNRQLALIED